MKRLTQIMLILLVATLPLAGCGGGGDDPASTGSLTTSPSSGPDTTTSGSESTSLANLDLYADNYVLDTNNMDSTTLTLTARDAANVALTDTEIALSATGGTLSTGQVVTGSDGSATATLSTLGETANQVVTVTATAGSLTKTALVTFSGTTLSLSSTKSSLLSGTNDSTEVTLTAKDANGNVIPSADVQVSSALGNMLGFDGISGSDITVTTDQNGSARIILTAVSDPGVETITADGLGAQKNLSLNVTNAQFGFTSPSDGSLVATGENKDLVITWKDDAGTPQVGKNISFTTTGGYFDGDPDSTSTSVLTDANGQARVTYYAGEAANLADIEADNGTETALISIQRVATDPSLLNLQVSPSIVSPSIADLTSTSNITATVRDSNGQAVADEKVVFTLLEGPGGGESISPGTATTDTGGQATTTFTSGSSISAQDGVKVRASLLSDPTIYADATLTIGKQAASIVIGSTNKINTYSVDGLEIGYSMPFSVTVVDTNGNPIENATVNLGVYSIYFYTGPVQRTGKFRNEDEDRDGVLDPGEDGAEGWYDDDQDGLFETGEEAVYISGSEGAPAVLDSGDPNGKLDPSGTISIPSEIVTDEYGFAAFEVRYPKSVWNWIDVELTATTEVTGSEAASKLVTSLGAMENDDPYPSSPFGN